MSTTTTLLAFAAVLLASRDAAAFCRTTTVRSPPDAGRCQDRGQALAWSAGCVGYRINPTRMPPFITLEQLRTIVRDGARAWAAVTCDTRTGAPPSFELLPLPDLDTPVGYLRDGPNYNTITFRDHWPLDAYHVAGSLAVTVASRNFRTGVILDADIEINADISFRFEGHAGAYDLPSIITHEFGHFLGLEHSFSPDAVMAPRLHLGERRDALTLDDATGVCTIYPPDRPAVCALESPVVHHYQGGGWYCAARPGERRSASSVWLLVGVLVASSRRRRPSVSVVVTPLT